MGLWPEPPWQDQGATSDAWETPLSLCPSVLPLPFAYRDSRPRTSLWRLFDDLCSETCKPVWHIYAKNMVFLKMERLYFHRAHLHVESLIYESTTGIENVPFLWIKSQLSTNSANTLTSFCKHFHVIQSLTSFVSTWVKLLGKITLFALKNHFVFRQFPRYSTPPASSWSWLTWPDLMSRTQAVLSAGGRWELGRCTQYRY